METLLLVADLAHGAPRGVLDRLCSYALRPAHLTSKYDVIGGDEGLACHARVRIGIQIEVDDRVGDAVADLVGMAFRHGFTGKEVTSSGH